MQSSKPINNLLHVNTPGLKILFSEFCIDSKFTFDSGINFFNCLCKTASEQFIKSLRKQFIYSKMINLKGHRDKYFSLEHVEFLEFICRVAFEWHEERKET